ncbi:hypothetical protein FA15DRAFT_611002 [Coprinopsis marcescibilis]|uniref:TRP C-terminal domain-containing protein n=1 Tax=Coprinopsis marcescibilis TaxID=230819 RepID=A0A5C3L840_COPMA|nr:hypothetical protein FA15DRAFT_611002 [Coprinopsis marcescibilis]
MSKPFPSSLPRIFALLLLFTSFAGRLARADPAVVPFRDCRDDRSENDENRFNISSIYAQVLKDSDEQHYLNLTVLGSSPLEIVGLTNSSSSLATLFTSTSVLTLNAWTNASYLCQNLRPPSPLRPVVEGVLTYCPIPAGDFAFSSTIPWGNNRELTTLNTKLRAVDPFGQELVCLDIATTPLAPTEYSTYGKANIILWSTVGLTLGYWAVVGIARITSAWNRGITRHQGKGVWSRAQSAGFIIASAISGERLASSPALLRFCTPSVRDVIFHTQWCALLGMVAVEWPQFIYPLLTQTAWATLAFNVTLTDDTRQHRWHPLTTPPFEPPSNFADQIADAQSPLYIDPAVPNTLFTLPPDATRGLSSFAYTLGIRPQDLFSVCLIIFLGIIAGTIVASAILWFIDVVVTNLVMKFHGQNSSYGAGNPKTRLGGSRSPGHTEALPGSTSLDESKPLTTNGFGLSRFPSGPLGGLTSSLNGEREQRDHGLTPRLWSWLRFRSDIGSFHGNVLHGNLVRILVWFHLPVTVFSCYQMTLPRSIASTTSITLAALSFVIFSIIIPAHLVIRVTFTTTNKLYDETRTLLSLGPLYNHYRHGSQLFASLFFATNIAFGVTVGAGQNSGTAQAIVILVVEVISALVTSIWLPWGSGASMGLISFLFCVARIVIAVLLVILTPTISIGPGPAGWVSYGILIVLALVYLALVLMLVVKLIEATVRIGGGIGFDKSRSAVDAGLIGTLSMVGFCGSRRKDASRKRSRAKSTTSKSNVYKSADVTGTPISGSGMFSPRRNSDLSSYNPPAALLSNESDRGSMTAPRFLGSADSRKGSTHSQPSFLRPEHANQPYREEIDQDWWTENENQGGAFIMGAWQPYGDSSRPHPPHHHHPPPRVGNAGGSASSSPVSSPPSSGFSRVGGGRAHIDNPYAIMQNPNASQQMPVLNPNSSTNTFPSIGQQGSAILTAPPLHATPSSQSHHHLQPPSHRSSPSRNYPPSAFQNYQNPNSPAGAYAGDEDEPPLPLSLVRQAQPVNTAFASSSVQPQHLAVDIGDLPPGAMPPAHVRTRSQTAIVEDAGASLYAANQSGASVNLNSASQRGMSARLSLPGSTLPPLKISSHRVTNSSSTGGIQQPPSAPARFTLKGDDDEDDDADSTGEDQHQKKKWYQFGKKRPHSSEGRTSTSGTGMIGGASSSSVVGHGGGNLREFGRMEPGDPSNPKPQRSFVVIRKPAGSMGRLNQGTAVAAASSSADQQRNATTPRSRPPTR